MTEDETPIDPDEVWKVLSQLGHHTHYLASKPISTWDEYDHSNYRSLEIKAGRRNLNDTKLKKVFVILVALDFENFDHYCKEPQEFYDSYEEANVQMNELLQTKQYEETQLKIQKLWKLKTNN